MIKTSQFALLSGIALLGSAAPCFAKEIVISDCDGTPRLVQDVETSVQSVALSLADKQGVSAKGVKVVLSNDSKKNEAVSNTEGKVTFVSIEPGAWRACVSADGISVSDIAVVQPASYATGATIGGLAVAGGIVAAAVGGSDGSSNNNDINTTAGSQSIGSGSSAAAPEVGAADLAEKAKPARIVDIGEDREFQPPRNEIPKVISPS